MCAAFGNSFEKSTDLRAVNKNHELKEARNSLELKMKKKKIVLKKNLAPNLVLYWHVIENGKQGLVKVICVSFHPQWLQLFLPTKVVNHVQSQQRTGLLHVSWSVLFDLSLN